ncbi:hypothetical protein [Komagataeibacter sp. FNDCR2]|uniref:hypothetical protein n=1 Tax=Komagataeibacter sp. FNDCR2 TaxID=2878682 RepID=UPI001E64AC46|nr:hypothetical protein [Komagataeibacter sp. FNDCR2]MCE2576694.1 hypothetical protein [Komagataeibacter sp. FNDCR2]
MGGVKFEYHEISFGSGGGNRGIYIQAGKDISQKYQFSPNPHRNPKYNKYQERFYNEAAKFLAQEFINQEQSKFPEPGLIEETLLGVEYTFEEPR